MCSRTRTFSKMATKRRPPIRSRDGDDHQNGTQLKDDLSNARQTRSGRSPRPPPSPRHDHRRVDPMDCGSCPRDGHVDVENSDESDEDPLLTDRCRLGSAWGVQERRGVGVASDAWATPWPPLERRPWTASFHDQATIQFIQLI
jgi:hypothetical protein